MEEAKKATKAKKKVEKENYLDILIRVGDCDNPSRCICIENKIDAKEGPEQTKRYVAVLEKNFPNSKHDYVFFVKNNSYVKTTSGNFKILYYREIEDICKKFEKIRFMTGFRQFYIQNDIDFIADIESNKKNLADIENLKLIDYLVYKFNTTTDDILCEIFQARRNSDGKSLRITKENWFLNKGKNNIHLEGECPKIALQIEQYPYESQDEESFRFRDDNRKNLIEQFKYKSLKNLNYKKPYGNSKYPIAYYEVTDMKMTCNEYFEQLKELVAFVDSQLKEAGVIK